jgi:hypothetical protein
MVFTNFRGATEVFRAKMLPEHAVWIHFTEVDALSGCEMGPGGPENDICISSAAYRRGPGGLSNEARFSP